MTEFCTVALAMATATGLTQQFAVFDVDNFSSACIFVHA